LVRKEWRGVSGECRGGRRAAFAYKCNHFVVQTSKTKSEIGKTKAKDRQQKQKKNQQKMGKG